MEKIWHIGESFTGDICIRDDNDQAVAVTVEVLDNRPETEENARLIAAAPELYRALVAVYGDIELQNVKGGSDELNAIVCEALRKVDTPT